MTMAEFYGAEHEEAHDLGLHAATLTQDDIDALATPEPTGLVVQDIPGVHTAAHSGDKEGWRAIRGRTVSATAATSMIGSNPFESQVELWKSRMEGWRKPFSAFAQRIMAYGTDAEPELLAGANEWLLDQFLEDPTPFVLTHGYVVDDADNPKRGATPDGWRLVTISHVHADLLGSEASPWGHLTLELVEFKTGSKSWQDRNGNVKVPQNYVDQMLWQMLVTGARRVLAVQRLVKRDKSGNVIAVLGHTYTWVEWDQDRVDALIQAVDDWLEMERTLTPPMVHIDAEDSFDDSPEESALKASIQACLTTIRDAEAAIAEVQEHVDAATAAKSRLKVLLSQHRGREVSTEWAGLGAKLSRSTKTGHDLSLLPPDLVKTIQTKTPVDTLRVTPVKGA
jgi:hypothetical protein